MQPDMKPEAQLPALAPLALSQGELIPLDQLSPQELSQVEAVAKSVDFTDGDSLLKVMSGPRQQFADAITRQLEGFAVYQTGAAAGIILDMSRQIKAANLAKMRREARGEDWVASTFGKLPVVGSWVSAMRHFQLTHKSLIGELDRIKTQAQRELNSLNATNRQLAEQEQLTIRMLRQMMVCIAGCEKAILAARADFEVKRARVLADPSPNLFEIESLRKYADNIVLLETRVLSAKTSFVDTMMAIPDIHAKQQAARIEMCNTIDTIQNDIPDLAATIGRLVAANNIRQAQEGTALRQENRRALAEINQQATNDVYLAAKRSQGRSLEEVDILSRRLDQLLATLEAGIEIDRQTAQQREEASGRLLEVRNRLLQGLSDHARRALTNA